MVRRERGKWGWGGEGGRKRGSGVGVVRERGKWGWGGEGGRKGAVGLGW